MDWPPAAALLGGGGCSGDREGGAAVPEAGPRRVRPAGRASAAGRQRWQRLGTLAVALGREGDAGGAAGGGGRRGRGRRGTVREVVGGGGWSGARTAGHGG